MGRRWTWWAIAAVALVGCKSPPESESASASASEPASASESESESESGSDSEPACVKLVQRLCELAPAGCEKARERLVETDPRCADWLADDELVEGLARGLSPGQGEAPPPACAAILKKACTSAPTLCPELTRRVGEVTLGAWDAARCESAEGNPAALERLLLALEAVDGRAKAKRTTPEAPRP